MRKTFSKDEEELGTVWHQISGDVSDIARYFDRK